MKEQLEILYGEYLQLHLSTGDYLVKRKYLEKMKAIDTLLEKMPYNFPNPVTETATV